MSDGSPRKTKTPLRRIARAPELSSAEVRRDQIERAKRAARGIQEATESLNVGLVRAEKALTGLALGVSASVPMGSPDDDNWIQCLRFAKDGNEWQLLLDSGTDGDPPELWSTAPLLRASREVRLKAAQYLPKLFEALIEEAETQAEKLRARSTRLDELLSTLEGGNQ
jgi:hypothetical protein